jgi:peptidoglycan/xylan/chitin deacetylase (PgdA/CDA1 family)/glycosyltransferase involved in cell wall biosynthesis
MSSEDSDPTSPLRCSVVIPTWKRTGTLRATLTAVLSQSYPSFEVHIVSDGEDPALRALAIEFSSEERLHWHVHATNRGQAAARNTGARAAEGDLLLFLDDDTPPAPDWIALHARHHRLVEATNPNVYLPIAVTGKIDEQPASKPARVTDAALQRNWEHTLERYAQLLQQSGPDSIGDEFDNRVAFGLNCSIPRALFLRHGGYLEQLRVTDEDMELGLRLYLTGVETVFEPAAIVTHRSTKDLTAYFRRCWQVSGATDVHRVFQLGQHNAQTRRLISITHGALPLRLLRCLFWFGGSALRSVVDILEGTANRTGSRLLTRAWGRNCPSTLYWQSVRSTGCTLRQLREQAAPAKCALMLHSLCAPETPQEATYYLSPKRFRLLMGRFCASGYRTVTTAQWMRDEVLPKHTLLTFDDGYDDLYTELLPWLQKYKFTALVFLVANHIGGTNQWDQKRGLRARNLLTLAQIHEMQRCGVEFGSHTLTHPSLPSLSNDDLHREVSDSRRKLEDMLGVEITSFAYPYGGVDRRVRAAVARAGYRLAFTTLAGVNRWNDPLCQNRADIHDLTTPFELLLHLRYGRGYRQGVAAVLRAVEQQAPTATLRGLAANLRRWGHRKIETRSGRKPTEARSQVAGTSNSDS